MSRRLSGLTSRWIRPRSCATPSAVQGWRATWTTRAGANGPVDVELALDGAAVEVSEDHVVVAEQGDAEVEDLDRVRLTRPCG